MRESKLMEWLKSKKWGVADTPKERDDRVNAHLDNAQEKIDSAVDDMRTVKKELALYRKEYR